LVVFSTYQSLQAIADAQGLRDGLGEFDLIICDEAHRTTGAKLKDKAESHFVKVHDENFIKARKRLYMTATPRLYGDTAKSKAKEDQVEIWSMDDQNLYGEEFYRLGFGEAVARGLLTDYQVMVLAVEEKAISGQFQKELADDNNELNLKDAVKIMGCWNGLAKRLTPKSVQLCAEKIEPEEEYQPMRRAVAFASSIKQSKTIVAMFSKVVGDYQKKNPEDETLLKCQLDHVDGTQNMLTRHQKLDWLKADTSGEGNICRILSNVRCLSEGVDVPALDAVMFLSPRGSVVDVVQSVGRVMRLAPGKKYGYIILPIGIPMGLTPEEALNDHKKYKVLWEVLQALRAHDDRFNAMVNKIELNKQKPTPTPPPPPPPPPGNEEEQLEIQMWRDAIYAKIVEK
jgi:predicted helicase